MSAWKTTTLGEVSVDGGHYGIAASAVDYSEDLPTYLRITDIRDDGTVIHEGLMSVDHPDARDYLLCPNDLVIARTGASTGRNYFYDGRDGDFVYAGFLIKFSISPSKIHPPFVKHWFQSPAYRSWLNSHTDGSTRANINAVTLGECPIRYPDIPTQKKIAAVLSSLDDKIENNRKICKNLEEQAQAIFKSWFVDFEPFGGEMPKGWKMGCLEDVGDIVGGATPSKAKSEYYTNQGIHWVTPKDLSVQQTVFVSRGETDITQAGFDSASVKLMPRGSVLFSSRAPIGYVAVAANDICTNQGFKSVVPKKWVGTTYVYEFLKSNVQLIEDRASGSTFKEISTAGMRDIPIVVPDETSLAKYESSVWPLFLALEEREKESRALAELRDALLPKLMSGEIDVEGVGL